MRERYQPGTAYIPTADAALGSSLTNSTIFRLSISRSKMAAVAKKLGVSVHFRIPVPSDIEISQSVVPAQIGLIAENVGARPG